MKVPFRQGLIQYQDNFLTKTGNVVYLNTTNKELIYTISFGNNEYLFVEPIKQNPFLAWTNIPSTGDTWLYIDINKNTAKRTFGMTFNEPKISSSVPFASLDNIPNDQHWFDVSTKRMKVWSSIHQVWTECIRIFVGKINNGTSIEYEPIGSQVGLSGQYLSGKILFDGYGKPIKKSDKTFFTSEDQWFVDGSNVQAGRLENDITTAIANENIPEFHVVKYTDFGRVGLARYNDTGNAALAISTDSGTYGELVNIVFQGTITNPNWNWPIVNAPLWVDYENLGSLTSVDPHSINSLLPKQVPVARVISPTTIIFQQGLGGVGPQGPRGTANANVSLASMNEFGISKLSITPVDPSNPIVVGDNDPRLTNARPPTSHTHPATQITTQPYGELTASNVQSSLEQLENQKLSKSGGTLTGYLNLHANPTTPLHAATKQYVDSIATGLRWIDPLCIVNLIGDDISIPPSSPQFGDAYLVPQTSGAGAWSGKGGHLMRWNGSTWEDLGNWLTGLGATDRRFGVSIASNTPARGTFTGHDNKIAIWTASTQSWSFYTPSNSDAFYVCNEISLYKFQQFVFDETRNTWVRFGGPQALVPGNQLEFVGNTLNVVEGHGSGLDADTLDGQHASSFASSSHNHDGSYVKRIGDVMTGTLTLSGSTSLIANTPATFNSSVILNNGLSVPTGNVVVQQNVTVGGNISTPSGTVNVSRDPLIPLEVATKQYVDNSSNPVPEFVAKGTIPSAGVLVGLNSDGTVSVIESSGDGEPTVGSHSSFSGPVVNVFGVTSAYDPVSNKVIVCYIQTPDYRGRIVIGTVNNDDTITFGSPVVFSNYSAAYIDIVPDPYNEKIILTYREYESGHYQTKALVGTITGGNISFGTPVVLVNNNGSGSRGVFDPVSNKIFFIYAIGFGAFQETYATLGTVTGNSISFSSSVPFVVSNAQYISITYDPHNNKFVITYRDGGDNGYGKIVTATIVANNIVFGTPVVFDAENIEYTSVDVNTTSNKFAIYYTVNDFINSLYYAKVVVGEISGNNITLGSPVIVHSATSFHGAMKCSSTDNKIVVSFLSNRLKVKFGTISGMSVSLGQELEVDMGGEIQAFAFVTNLNKFVFSYNFYMHPSGYTGRSVVISAGSLPTTNKDTFIGIAQRSANNNERVPVKIQYSIDSNQSGLTPGSIYYVNDNGQLTTTSTNNILVGIAISPTEIFIGNRIDKNGDTMTGFLTLHADPTANMHAATKQYVDSSLTNVAKTDAVNVWTRAQSGAIINLTSSGGNIQIDLSLSNNFVHQLTTNSTLQTPINPTPGQSGMIEIRQGSTPRTLTFSPFWRFSGGTPPSLTNTANARDVISYFVNADGTSATCVLIENV